MLAQRRCKLVKQHISMKANDNSLILERKQIIKHRLTFHASRMLIHN